MRAVHSCNCWLLILFTFANFFKYVVQTETDPSEHTILELHLFDVDTIMLMLHGASAGFFWRHVKFKLHTTQAAKSDFVHMSSSSMILHDTA